ncbi:hypothetical protein DY000_02060778 [Brassica cretica]|uniref:Uncharacterized protein n=1 Tax=Brassica cretica TaxID=69181 RepID=A0ABQ7AWH4_BRACR|nr:hypothetical protein DY000_02060778 [Brassica cretica]
MVARAIEERTAVRAIEKQTAAIKPFIFRYGWNGITAKQRGMYFPRKVRVKACIFRHECALTEEALETTARIYAIEVFSTFNPDRLL